jgi:hypothetical protein
MAYYLPPVCTIHADSWDFVLFVLEIGGFSVRGDAPMREFFANIGKNQGVAPKINKSCS